MLAKLAVIIYNLVILLSQLAASQIPTVCTNEGSLSSLKCCPDDCGAARQRGQCKDIGLPHSMTTTDVRGNWPHYFTRACQCQGNYGGYDCSRCKFGYYGEDCRNKAVLPREPIHELSDEQWREYISILNMTRTYTSDYSIVLEEYQPGTTDITTTSVNLYDLFVWRHHYAAKDSTCKENDDCINIDYAHDGTGFPTWHRLYLIWFEWETQYMLQSIGYPNYHTFRVHYWDWRREDRADDIFQRNTLGTTIPNENGQPQVYGNLFEGGWDTVCWYNGSGGVSREKGAICNPDEKTGPLLRCPFLSPNPCNSSNPHWPSPAEVETALNKPMYDTEAYNVNATMESFRNFMEGFDHSVGIEECAGDDMCKCKVGGFTCEGANASAPIRSRLHNVVHIIPGVGDLSTDLPGNMSGVMDDTAASPNDPIFLNHHAMIDCMLEAWLQHHPDAPYPDVPPDLKGHQKDASVAPFFPVFTHNDMFQTADNFGYSCELPNLT